MKIMIYANLGTPYQIITEEPIEIEILPRIGDFIIFRGIQYTVQFVTIDLDGQGNDSITVNFS